MTSVELYSEQDAETKVIVPTLKKLGYDEQDPGRNVVVRFRHSITAHQGRQTRTIFADIVVFINNAPVIVIDSKNPRQFLTENDKEQVISYARLIGDIASYAVLCNGHTWQVFDTISKQQIQDLPAYDELLADLQRRRLSGRQRRDLQTQATRTLFAIDSARELSRIMRQCHDVIRNMKGYDPTRAFDELSKILFAKMYEERELAAGRRTTNRFTSDFVEAMREQGVEIIQTLWQDTVTSDEYQDVFSDQEETRINLPPAAIDKIVEILEDWSLGLTDLDVKGVAFEEFLATTYRGGGLGQYFTPREVVNFMVDLVDPTIGEKLIDPACGTGGFLIRAYDVVSNKIQASELTSEEKQERLQSLATQCLVGIDWEPRAARTCKMNMIIHGDGHAGVYQANSLRLDVLERKVAQRQSLNPRAPSVEEGTFDIVLTNPPFGARDSDNSILEEFELGRGRSAKREVLMIERCIRLLRPGGRMAVVVPEGILSNKLDKRIRDFIRRECVLKAIIRLPQDAFKMSGGAACTSIIYAVKRDPNVPDLQEQDDVFFARAEYIGTTPSGKPIEQNDLLAIKEQFRRFEEGEWTGIELRSRQGESMDILRSVPTGDSRLWLEPEVNRTSLLYDRLSYVVRDPQIVNRYSYTYFHPRYYEIVNELGAMLTEVADLESLCVAGYPTRGKKPSQESSEGIPILKVRNITGRGIDLDTEYAPNTEKIREDCAEAIVQQNDVLITCTGEGTIGRADVYPYKDIAIADGHVSICRLGPGIDPWYVLEYLRSEHGQIQMLRHISGSTGQTELLRQYVKGLRIPVPELSLQEELVHLMREARDRADHLREKARHLHNESIRVIAEARDQMIRKLQA